MLTSDQMKAIQDIVGPQWVTDDPCCTDTYSIHRNPEWTTGGKSPWLPRPTAVVTPATAQEIAELVRFCNKTGLMVKPLSTGLGPESAVSREGVIQIDLKRMNKIIDIDVKNQIAVVEPYVKAIRLQTELWKQGLNVNVVSCGGTSSVLASTTSGWGYGFSGPGLGYSGRNYMGAEWVSPAGEIITLGSAGHGAGWFSAEGPGPSMRGILRGQWGSLGGLGVYTKAAVKLYKWDGPPQPEVTGSNPHYYLRDPLPSNMGFFMLACPTQQALKDIGYKLGEAEIAYADCHLPVFQSAYIGGGSDWSKVEEVMSTGFFQKMTKNSLIIAVIGHSQREFDWKKKAITQIVKEVDGASMPVGVQPSIEQLKMIAPFIKALNNPLRLVRWLGGLADGGNSNSAEKQHIISELFMFLLRHAINLQGAYPMPNSFFTLMGSLDTWDKGVNEGACSDGLREKYIDAGGLIDDGGQGGIGGTYENGHLGYMEALAMYTPSSRKSVKSFLSYSDDAHRVAIKSAYGLGLLAAGDERNRQYGPHCSNYHEWMVKIKRALDPNTSSDPGMYIDPGKA